AAAFIGYRPSGEWRVPISDFESRTKQADLAKVQPSCFRRLLRLRDGLPVPDSTMLSLMTVELRKSGQLQRSEAIMTILIILIAISGVALGAIGAVWAQDYWRQRTAPRELKPILDWRPTLRMDARAAAQAELAEDDNVPASWTLQAEEVRLVESVSGYPHLEIRWRPATRREVRDFISTYQRSRSDEIKEHMNKL